MYNLMDKITCVGIRIPGFRHDMYYLPKSSVYSPGNFRRLAKSHSAVVSDPSDCIQNLDQTFDDKTLRIRSLQYVMDYSMMSQFDYVFVLDPSHESKVFEFFGLDEQSCDLYATIRLSQSGANAPNQLVLQD